MESAGGCNPAPATSRNHGRAHLCWGCGSGDPCDGVTPPYQSAALGGIGVPHFPVLVGRVWQCPQRGRGPAVLTRPGVRLQEALGLLPWVSGRNGLAGCHGVQGSPGGVRGTASPSCPGGLCTGAGSAALAAKSFLGQPGGCPSCLGGCRLPWAGQWAGVSVAWGTWELLPAFPGRRLWCTLGTRRHRQEQVWPAGGSA